MRIAFFGGSFDPPHHGHIAIARAAADRLSLDRVLIAPVGRQPLKQEESAPASFADRLAMVRLAVTDDPRLVVSTIDSPREDGKPNYTFDSLAELKQGLAAEDLLFCLVGADSYLTMKKWYRAAELLLETEFIVAGRPGFSLEDAGAALPDGIRAAEVEEGSGYVRLRVVGGARASSKVYLLPDLDWEISATQIRRALANRDEPQSLLSEAVVEYIRVHALYR
jgi:nicotinate-nucleotide adenylyltransferase